MRDPEAKEKRLVQGECQNGMKDIQTHDASLCLLKRLQKASLVGQRVSYDKPKSAAVSQRLVEANHQASKAREAIGSQSVNTRVVLPAVIRRSYAIFLHREEAYSQEFRETPHRSPSSFPAGNPA